MQVVEAIRAGVFGDAGCGGRGRTPFADYMRTMEAAPATPSHIVLFDRNNAQPLLGQGGVQQAQNLDYSDTYK
jgi:hypothetical protein